VIKSNGALPLKPEEGRERLEVERAQYGACPIGRKRRIRYVSGGWVIECIFF